MTSEEIAQLQVNLKNVSFTGFVSKRRNRMFVTGVSGSSLEGSQTCFNKHALHACEIASTRTPLPKHCLHLLGLHKSRSKQELSAPNLGCIFPKYGAARTQQDTLVLSTLVLRAGLKGGHGKGGIRICFSALSFCAPGAATILSQKCCISLFNQDHIARDNRLSDRAVAATSYCHPVATQMSLPPCLLTPCFAQVLLLGKSLLPPRSF